MSNHKNLIIILLGLLSMELVSQEMGNLLPRDSIVYDSNSSSYTLFDPIAKSAEFPGGMDSLYSYLYRNIKWVIGEKDIDGTVIVSFIVEINGFISNTRIERSLEESCDNEAIRLVQNMPIWKPAELEDMKVRSKFYLPIKFYKWE